MSFLILADAASSLVAQSVENGSASAIPNSSNNDTTLFTLNLLLMTATTFLGAMMFGKQARRTWIQCRYDHPKDPVTIYRAMLMLAALGIALRCAAGAMVLEPR